MIHPYANEEQLHDTLQKACDKFLITRFGMGWNDLPDTVSLWDWMHDGFLGSDISGSLVKEICWEKLADEYPSRCELNEIIYGECSCFLHDEEE